MLSYVSIVLLAFAVSLDSFGVGLNYGLRRIKIPKTSILIIAGFSGMMMFVSMLLGALIAPILPEQYASWTGGAILIIIGLWAFIQMRRQKEHGEEHQDSSLFKTEQPVPGPKRVLHLEFRRLGIVIEILRTPSTADIDRSGTITSGEAVLLGTALALDAFGAGIGAAFIGLTPWLTAPMIAMFCAIFLWLGYGAGQIASHIAWLRKLSFLPSVILIVLGLSKLLQ